MRIFPKWRKTPIDNERPLPSLRGLSHKFQPSSRAQRPGTLLEAQPAKAKIRRSKPLCGLADSNAEQGVDGVGQGTREGGGEGTEGFAPSDRCDPNVELLVTPLGVVPLTFQRDHGIYHRRAWKENGQWRYTPRGQADLSVFCNQWMQMSSASSGIRNSERSFPRRLSRGPATRIDARRTVFVAKQSRGVGNPMTTR